MDFPGKDAGVGCHFLLQEIFLIQGANPCLLYWQVDSVPPRKSHISHCDWPLLILKGILFPFCDKTLTYTQKMLMSALFLRHLLDACPAPISPYSCHSILILFCRTHPSYMRYKLVGPQSRCPQSLGEGRTPDVDQSK